MAKNYGTRARLVNQRLKDLEAAPALETMKILGGNCHELRQSEGKIISEYLTKPQDNF